MTEKNMEDCLYYNFCDNDDCTDSCIRYVEMKYLLKSSLIPKHLQKPISLYPESYDKEAFIKLKDIKSNIVNFVNNGKNLFIQSNHTGNGKTSWSIKLMLKYFDEIWAGNGLKTRALFISVPQFLFKLKDFNTTDLEFESLKKLIPVVDLVVFDDIGSTKISDYDNSQLLNYIDQRISNGKSNIFTSNVDNSKLESVLGNRLYSRVVTNSIVIKFYGNDRRGE